MEVDSTEQCEWEWGGYLGQERLWVRYGVPEYLRGEVAGLTPLNCSSYLEALEVFRDDLVPLCPHETLTLAHYAAIGEAWTERRENP